MQFDEMGSMSGKTLMLLPGTACDYQTNFAAVLDRLGEKYQRRNHAVSVLRHGQVENRRGPHRL